MFTPIDYNFHFLRILGVCLCGIFLWACQSAKQPMIQTSENNCAHVAPIQDWTSEFLCGCADKFRGPRKWDARFNSIVTEMLRRELVCSYTDEEKISAISIAINGNASIEEWNNSALCEFASIGSPKEWDMNFLAAVLEAERRGADCGVSLHDPKANIFADWPDSTLCWRATVYNKDPHLPKRWSRYYPYAVQEARKRGLTCGVKERY